MEEKIDGAMARMSEPEWAPFRPGNSYFAPSQPAGAALCLLELDVEGLGRCRPMGSPTTRSAPASAGGYPCSAYLVDGSLLRNVDLLVRDKKIATVLRKLLPGVYTFDEKSACNPGGDIFVSMVDLMVTLPVSVGGCNACLKIRWLVLRQISRGRR